MANKEIKVESVVIVGQNEFERQLVENELKKHGVSKVVHYDKPSQLNGQLESKKSKRPILLLLTGQEDTSWNTIQTKWHSCPKTDKLLVRSSNNKVGLLSRLLELGADAVFKRDEDVWEVIRRVLGSV